MENKAPKVTDHPFVANPIINNKIKEDSPEGIRKKNNRARDIRNGYRVTDNFVYPSS